jgi:hypothetical protein
MSDESDLDDVENLLREAPLRQPTAQLDARVSSALRQPGLSHPWRRMRIASLSMAAALAIAAGSFWAFKHFAPAQHLPLAQLPTPEPLPLHSSASLQPSAKPMSFVRTISNITDDGIISTTEGVPIRRYRRQSIQHVLVLDSRGKSVAFSVPREEVVFVKVRAF